MATIRISRVYQIIIFAGIIVLAVIFFFYFYRQASVAPAYVNHLNVPARQPNSAVNSAVVNMNLDLFNTEKFLNLRSEVAPAQSYQSGKRNPFEPQ
jgi:hypothetical protein